MTKRLALTRLFCVGLLFWCILAGTLVLAQSAPFGIATIAGSPYDPSGDGGPASQASINFASGSVAYRDGNVYVTNGARVQKISPDGIISTVAGQLDPILHQPIPGFSADGGPALGTRLRGATALEFDSTGNLYIGDSGNSCVRKITARVVNGVPQPIDGSETIRPVAGVGASARTAAAGGPATPARLMPPRGLSFDPSTGAPNIADQKNNNVRRVAAAENTPPVAGNGTTSYGGPFPPIGDG